jgi:FkbM family methyltransferase
MKKLILFLYYLHFDLICRLWSVFYEKYSYFSFRSMRFITSPTLAQLRAANRDIGYRNINKYKKLFKRFDLFTKPNQVLLDIGGNIGYTAIAFNKASSQKARIYTFEPSKQNIKYLKKNINGLSIHLCEVGLGLKNQSMYIGYPDYVKKIKNLDNRNNTGRLSLLGLSKKANNSKVKIVNGDNFLKKNQIDNIKFIKIDVEGYEFQVMNGLIDTIKRDKPLIQLEYNKVTSKYVDNSYMNYIDFCLKHNYKVYLFKQGNLSELTPKYFNKIEHVEEFIMVPI